MSESSATHRRSSPFPTVRQFSMFFVMATAFIGQAIIIIDSIGMWSEIGGLYETGFLFLVIWVFYPQVNYVLSSVLIRIGNRIGGEPDEQ